MNFVAFFKINTGICLCATQLILICYNQDCVYVLCALLNPDCDPHPPPPQPPLMGGSVKEEKWRSTHAFIVHADNLPKMLECIHFGLHTLTEWYYQRWFVFNETSSCDLYLSYHPSPFLNVHTSGWVWTISRKRLLEKLSVVSPSLFNIKSLIVRQKVNRRWFPMLFQGSAVCIFNKMNIHLHSLRVLRGSGSCAPEPFFDDLIMADIWKHLLLCVRKIKVPTDFWQSEKLRNPLVGGGDGGEPSWSDIRAAAHRRLRLFGCFVKRCSWGSSPCSCGDKFKRKIWKESGLGQLLPSLAPPLWPCSDSSSSCAYRTLFLPVSLPRPGNLQCF